MTGRRFHQERRDVRTYNRGDPLAYIVRELPARLAALVDQLHFPPNGRVLDYGCADTPYRRHFGPSVEYLAADLPGNPAANVTIGEDGTVPIADASVDIVVSTQVLEHVDDPATYLRECHRVLRAEGQLLLSTHGFMVYHPDPVDFWRWTSAGLNEIVTRAGFDVLHSEGIMGLTATGLHFVQEGIAPRLTPKPRRLLAFVMQSLIGLVDKHEPVESRDCNALVFAVIARKPGLASSGPTNQLTTAIRPV